MTWCLKKQTCKQRIQTHTYTKKPWWEGKDYLRILRRHLWISLSFIKWLAKQFPVHLNQQNICTSFCFTVILTIKNNFMAPFYGWSSTIPRLWSHYKETIYFLTLSPQEALSPGSPGTHLIDLRRMKGPPWTHPKVLNQGLMDWESSALVGNCFQIDNTGL